MDGWLGGWTEEWTNGMDGNYIPLRHTWFAGGIIRVLALIPLVKEILTVDWNLAVVKI